MLLPIPNEPQESIPIHFMTQLLEWNGMDVILMAINRFSKLAKVAPIQIITTTFKSIIFFINMWVKHHGMPQFIVSDRNVKFMVGF
jgi:hypothetical protein